MNTPCKGCAERHTACWSDCPKYAEYRAQVDAARKAAKKENAAIGLLAESTYYVKKRKNITW